MSLAEISLVLPYLLDSEPERKKASYDYSLPVYDGLRVNDI